jgi:hypothetical protein
MTPSVDAHLPEGGVAREERRVAAAPTKPSTVSRISHDQYSSWPTLR